MDKGKCVSVKTHPLATNNTLQSASCDVKKRFICEVGTKLSIFVSKFYRKVNFLENFRVQCSLTSLAKNA